MKPPAPGTPLPSADLEQDAKDANISSDEAVEGGGDAHLPASDAELVTDADRDRPPHPNRALTNLPPG